MFNCYVSCRRGQTYPSSVSYHQGGDDAVEQCTQEYSRTENKDQRWRLDLSFIWEGKGITSAFPGWNHRLDLPRITSTCQHKHCHLQNDPKSCNIQWLKPTASEAKVSHQISFPTLDFHSWQLPRSLSQLLFNTVHISHISGKCCIWAGSRTKHFC